VYVSPTVVGDTLYIGSCSGSYYALDRATGAIRWTYDTGVDGPPASFHGDPVTSAGLIVTGSDHTLGGYAYAFDLETGELAWRLDVGGLESDLVAEGSRVIGATSDGGLIALDLESGDSRRVVCRVRDVDRETATAVVGDRCTDRCPGTELENTRRENDTNVDDCLRSVGVRSGKVEARPGKVERQIERNLLSTD